MTQPAAGLGFQTADMQGRNIIENHFVSANVSEQRLVTLELDNVDLVESLRRLAHEARVGLSFESHLIPDKKVTVNFSAVPFYEALDKLLEDTSLRPTLASSRDVLVLKKDKEEIVKIVQQVTGTVTDSQTGQPLTGVNVAVQGTNIGTITDQNGEYSLEVPDAESVIVFSYVGYETQRVTVGDQQVIDVDLVQGAQTMDEVVVVGYGEMERRSLTGSISQVENDDLDQQPVMQPGDALAGRLAGVSITKARNTPGASPTIRVRGPSSISASNDPLIVIDGFPGGSFDNINMNDVESIEVLKDASAAAIYGSRGSGGVIMVTTKSGGAREGAKFSLSSYAGIQYPMIHGEENWVDGGQAYKETIEKYINREWIWEGGDPDIPMWGDERRPNNFRVNPVVAQGDNNWESILFEPSPIQNYQMSAQGGSENFTYYVSGTYQNEEGVMPTSWYKQYSLRTNLHADITDNVRVDFRINPRYSRQRNKGGSGINNQIKMPPFVEPKMNPETGKYYEASDYWSYRVSAAANPLNALYGSHFYNDSFKNMAEARLGVDLLDNLTYEVNLGTDVAYNTYDRFTEKTSSGRNQNTGSAGSWRNHSWLVENTLNYTTSLLGVHNITALAGATYQKSESRSENIYALTDTYQDEVIRTLNNATAAPYSGSSKTQWGLASYFGRVNYDFDDKYLLSASYRVDGSSRFGPKNRWGTFPSASIGWLVSEEAFMQEVDFINELKLRAGYGEVGNFGIGNFQYLGTISDAAYALNGERFVGRAQSNFGNEELRWETTKSMDVGLDVSMFDRRVSLMFDYYEKNTSDLLYAVSIPSISGFSSTLVNVGDIVNRGIELELNTTNIRGKDVSWQTAFNFSRNRNEVTSLRGDVEEVINLHSRGMGWILRKGEPMFSFYGHEMIGVHMDQASIDNNPSKAGAVPGTAMYKDTNGDGEITDEDREILGNFMPDFEWGMTNNVQWRNFDLSIHIQSKIGGYRYNLENLWYQGPTVSAFLKPTIEGQWWSPDDPGDGETPATSLAYLDYVSDTDYYLEPADYVAIRNINFGYELPSSIKNYLGVDNLRAYLSVQNAFMFTRSEFKAYNPEGYTTGAISGTGSLPGYNTGAEPLNRTVVLGVNLDF
ncbi:SusC/RagA family TonB-linked outer membrane protein [Fodinibius sediminis]|uniref:SusC/RagA family TonB-linked outer membrane protein n=1 Tax=Fodinibius sediminis TaxID=1214077 RepID=UPI00163D6F26|nr:TonB-dependent receptor [Fodinibius sediminis]